MTKGDHKYCSTPSLFPLFLRSGLLKCPVMRLFSRYASFCARVCLISMCEVVLVKVGGGGGQGGGEGWRRCGW